MSQNDYGSRMKNQINKYNKDKIFELLKTIIEFTSLIGMVFYRESSYFISLNLYEFYKIF